MSAVHIPEDRCAQALTGPGDRTSLPSSRDTAPHRSVARNAWVRAGTEIALILGLYVLYCASRTLADDALGPARAHAADVLHVENALGLAWETTMNQWFVVSDGLGLLGSYWYATMHYVVTGTVLVWLWTRGAAVYRPARTALIIATLLALAAYLALPTAPPRLVGGYVDVLSLTSHHGWWGADASAPKGLGGLTNQLAAFPSLHAGWSLWVAIVLRQHTRSRVLWVLGAAYALTTGVVIVGTGNHWVLDAVVGWVVVGLGFLAQKWVQRWAHKWTRRWARSLPRRGRGPA